MNDCRVQIDNKHIDLQFLMLAKLEEVIGIGKWVVFVCQTPEEIDELKRYRRG